MINFIYEPGDSAAIKLLLRLPAVALAKAAHSLVRSVFIAPNNETYFLKTKYPFGG